MSWHRAVLSVSNILIDLFRDQKRIYRTKIWEPGEHNYLICWLKSREDHISSFLSNHCLQHQGRKYVYKPWDRDNSLGFSSSRPVTNHWASETWFFLSLFLGSAHLSSTVVHIQQGEWMMSVLFPAPCSHQHNSEAIGALWRHLKGVISSLLRYIRAKPCNLYLGYCITGAWQRRWALLCFLLVLFALSMGHWAIAPRQTKVLFCSRS